MRIDNASNIYTASRCKSYLSVYRMSVTMSEPIDKDILQTALEHTLVRIPLFSYTVRNTLLGWKLQRMSQSPVVSPYDSMSRFDIESNGGFLFKISTKGRTMYMDIFHAIADGHGSQTFILTLAAEYLRLKYHTEIAYSDTILDPFDEPRPEELSDDFDLFKGKKGALERNDPAYHIAGTEDTPDHLNIVRLKVPIGQAHKVAQKYDCTITELLTACMVSAIQDIRHSDKDARKSTNIKVSIPVNLREMFGGQTLRNFSSYVNVGVDMCNGKVPFNNIVKGVKYQKRALLTRECVEKKVAVNVALESNKYLAAVPRGIKRLIIDAVNKRKGDRFNSQTLSNLGLVELPDGMAPYITELGFILGKRRGNAGATTCIGYNGHLYINCSRKIIEHEYEDGLCQTLRALGLRVETEYLDA